MSQILKALIRLYQIVLSPLLGRRCRFQPTCSRYTAQAIELHGPIKGAYIGLRRICRCHPWGGHGYDPVPGSPEEITFKALNQEAKSSSDKAQS